MREDEVRSFVASSLATIAPEIDLAHVDPDEDLRRAVDIDSFDFLKLLIALNEHFKIEIPESDYAKFATLNSLVSYIIGRLPA
jgi:acyl carrier protein